MLAMYMGHVSIVSIFYSLKWMPDIATAASDRFEARFGHLIGSGSVMKRALSNDLGLAAPKFFRQCLPTLRRRESLHHSQLSRRLDPVPPRFVSSHSDQRLEESLSRPHHRGACDAVLDVPGGLGRLSSIATRRLRLAALHTFARFLAAESPEHLAKWQRVLGLPFKRGARNAPIDYLESTEAEAYRSLGRSAGPRDGRRDFAVVRTHAHNAGSRVREMRDSARRRTGRAHRAKSDFVAEAVRCDTAQSGPRPPARAAGAGGAGIEKRDDRHVSVLCDRRSASLTRFGVRLSAQQVHRGQCRHDQQTAREANPPALAATYHGDLPARGGRRISRRDQPMAKTNDAEHDDGIAARADLDLKRQALAQVFPEAVAPPVGETHRI